MSKDWIIAYPLKGGGGEKELGKEEVFDGFNIMLADMSFMWE